MDKVGVKFLLNLLQISIYGGMIALVVTLWKFFSAEFPNCCLCCYCNCSIMPPAKRMRLKCKSPNTKVATGSHGSYNSIDNMNVMSSTVSQKSSYNEINENARNVGNGKKKLQDEYSQNSEADLTSSL